MVLKKKLIQILFHIADEILCFSFNIPTIPPLLYFIIVNSFFQKSFTFTSVVNFFILSNHRKPLNNN